MDLDKVIKGLELCLGSIDSAGCPEGCPYYEACQKYENLVVFQPLMRDALEALKAQEPRALTLEEVKNSEVVYLEDYSDPDYGESSIIRPAINVEVKNGRIFMLDSIAWDEGYIVNSDDDYGKEWRCWNSRPTDEQRKAVKWE